MKIAHLVSTFPPHIGGMGRVCFEEAKRLSANHEIIVLTLDYGNRHYDDSRLPFRVRRLKPLFRLGDGGLLLNLNSELTDFDMVHLHYPFYGGLGSLITAKKLIGFPLVVTYHMDPQGTGMKKVLQSLYDSVYSKKIFDLADRIIAVDKDYFNGSKFAGRAAKGGVSFLSNGVDTEVFAPRILSWRELGLPKLDSKKVILFVGNFLPVKNLDFLIGLLPDLRQDAVLLVVGGGYDEMILKNLTVNTPYENRIVFAGSLGDQAQLSAYYASADAVAVPSRSESFSLVTLEAMASGGLVVASDIAGIRGRIEPGVDGYLAPVLDRDAWIGSLNNIFLLPSAVRQTASEKARAKAEKYSWEEHVKALVDLYREFA